MSRIKQTISENADGTIDIGVNCSCGKPIVQSNKYGMYCEDKCGEKEDKEAYLKVDGFINSFSKIWKK